MNKETAHMLSTLQGLGISWNDAITLRRISMTLHRWHELECGDGNSHASWCITRGKKNGKEFVHDEAGKPYMEYHPDAGKASYSPIPDREAGALKRLRILMAKYGYIGLSFYVQTDPRGAALYILRPGDVPKGEDADAYYSRGVAVYK